VQLDRVGATPVWPWSKSKNATPVMRAHWGGLERTGDVEIQTTSA
jgi:hypothetical protein